MLNQRVKFVLFVLLIPVFILASFYFWQTLILTTNQEVFFQQEALSTQPEASSSGHADIGFEALSTQPEVLQSSVWDTDRSLLHAKVHNGGQRESCLSGHGIENMPPICGTPECLVNLVTPPNNTPLRINISTSFLQLIKKIPPRNSNERHIAIVNMLTHIQWSHGVYGTVGEIGLHYGKFTVILALHTDTDRGERLFACDIYDKLGRGYVDLDLKNQVKNTNWTRTREQFLKTMAKTGFSPDQEDLAKRLYFWFDSSVYLSKYAFLQMGLPSVRLMSVDGYHYDTFVWYELIQVFCILRSGGIMIIDDIVSAKWSPAVKRGLVDFHTMISSNIISPLIQYRNKLYITSSEWHDTYINDIEEALKTREDVRSILQKSVFHTMFTKANLTYFK